MHAQNHLQLPLHSYRNRLGLVLGWNGLGRGAFFGGMIALLLVVMDFYRWIEVTWLILGLVIGTCALIGLVTGLFWRVKASDLAESVDRRGGFESRVTAAFEGEDGPFAVAIQREASERLKGARAAKLYPFRATRWHFGAVLSASLACGSFYSFSTGILLNAEQKAERKEVQEAGAQLERVVNPMVLPKKLEDKTQQERALALKMKALSAQMEKARLTKEESLRKSNELAAEADKLTQEKINKAEKNLNQSQTSMEALKELSKADPNAQSPDDPNAEKLDQMMQQLNERVQDISQLPKDQKVTQDQLARTELALQQAQNELKAQGKLSEAERKQMEAAQKEMSKLRQDIQNGKDIGSKERQQLNDQMKRLQELAKKFELSKEAQDMLKMASESKEFKELQEMMKKLQENQKQMKQTGQPKLSDQDLKKMQEDMQKMQQQLEQLAKELKDPEKMKQFQQQMKQLIEQMNEAMKNQMSAAQMMQMGMALAGLMGMNSPLGTPGNDLEEDVMGNDTKKVKMRDDEMDLKGTGSKTTMIQGQRADQGKESYIEVRGPTGVGLKSSVPYQKVLPSYKKRAEEAMRTSKIPKSHEKRVRDYFDSLGGK